MLALVIEQTKEGIRLNFVGSEDERQALIEFHEHVSTDARLFAFECVKILIEQYGARRQGINFEHFYYAASQQRIAKVIDGKEPMVPAQAVARALENMRPCYLGLETPSQSIQAIIDRGWAELSGEQPCTDRK